MIREHLNITGGWQWLPFLRSQVKKFCGVVYASQKYTFPDSATGRFVKEGEIVHIYLEGGGAWIAWAPDVEVIRSEVTYRAAVAPPPYDPPDEPEYAPNLTNPPGIGTTITWYGWMLTAADFESVPYRCTSTARYTVPQEFVDWPGAPTTYRFSITQPPTNEGFNFSTEDLAMATIGVQQVEVLHTLCSEMAVEGILESKTKFVKLVYNAPGDGSATYVLTPLFDGVRRLEEFEYGGVGGGSYSLVRETRFNGLYKFVYNGVDQFTPYYNPTAADFTGPDGIYSTVVEYDTVAADAWNDANNAITAANLALYNAWVAAVDAYALAWPDVLAAHFLAARIPERIRQQELISEEVSAGLVAKYLAGGIWFDYVPKRQRATPLYIKQTGYTAVGTEGGIITYEVTDYTDRDKPAVRDLVGTWSVLEIDPVSGPAYGTIGSSLFTFTDVLPNVAARAGFDSDKPWTLPGDYHVGQLINGTQENFDAAHVQNFTYTSPAERAAWLKLGDVVQGSDPIAPGTTIHKGSELVIVALEYETYDRRFTNGWQWMTSGLWTIDPILPAPPETSVPDSFGSDVDPGPTPRAVRSVAVYKQKYDYVDPDDHSLGLEWKPAEVVGLPEGTQHFTGSITGVEHTISELGDTTTFPFAVFVLRGVASSNFPLDKLDDAVVTTARISADPTLRKSLSGEWGSITSVDALRDRLTMEALQLLKLTSEVTP